VFQELLKINKFKENLDFIKKYEIRRRVEEGKLLQKLLSFETFGS